MSNEANPTRKSSRKGWLIAAAVGLAAVALAVLAVGGIGKNLVYYWGPTEVKAAGPKAVGATIRLGGLVAVGSLRRTAGVSGLEFDVIDRQGQCLHVKGNAMPPQMFREKIGVVVEGTMTEAGHFESRRLMVSHDNEYRVPGDKAAKVVDDKLFTCSQSVADAKP
jgi:cytochrome c-type biogenesis protein CcmE